MSLFEDHEHSVGDPVAYYCAPEEAPTAGQLIRVHGDHVACVAYYCQKSKSVKEATSRPHGNHPGVDRSGGFFLCPGEALLPRDADKDEDQPAPRI